MGERGWLVSGIAADTGTVRFRWRRLGGEDDLKVPDTKRTHVDQTLDIEQCRTKCLNDCSCMAYTNSNISGAGSGFHYRFVLFYSINYSYKLICRIILYTCVYRIHIY